MCVAATKEKIDSLVAQFETSESLDVAALGTFDEGSNRWRLEAYFSDPPDRAALTAILKSELGPDAPLPDPLIEELPDQDWVAKVQKELPPVRAGRFLVHGSHDRDRIPISRLRIEIDAGQAFGTAHHETTRGCLRALDGLLKEIQFQHIADIGTGSGILAIAAAKALRTASIVASDSDPIALRVAQENFRKNGVHSQIQSVLSAGFCHQRLRHKGALDLLFANILAGPLKTLASEISDALQPQGHAVLSGVLDEQAPSLESRCRLFGLVVNRRYRIGGWTTLVLKKAVPKRKTGEQAL